jgi:hypothetical protein
LVKCKVHEFFFDWSCHLCKEEYNILKGKDITCIVDNDKTNKNSINRKTNAKLKKYKEFDEERAKKLYQDIFLQYLKSGNISEEESITRSKMIIRKQCEIRGIKPWSWI